MHGFTLTLTLTLSPQALAGHDAPLSVINHLRTKLDAFKQHLPLIGAMLNPGLRDRHWRQLTEATGRSLKPTPGVTTLAMLLEEGVGKDLVLDLYKIFIHSKACLH